MLPQALLITCGNRRSGFDLNATDITTLLNNNIHLHFVFIASLLRLYCESNKNSDDHLANRRVFSALGK
jgi:hypothetical protein